MKKITYIVLAALTFTQVSCEKYLDVTPKSSISEKQIFETEIGFQQALSGVYAELSTASLYGDRLSLGFVSALAQNYNMTTTGAPYKETTALNYTSTEVVSHLKTIWNQGYKSIAGINNILNHTVSNRNVLSNSNYALIRGEALGLRAYVHFDLLRLFGPHPSASGKAIPYETTVDNFATVPGTTTEVLTAVLKDLEEAAQLLAGEDPVRTSSVSSRQIKMNYFAVKALEARVRLYMGDKAGAHEAASIVVAAQKFPFVDVSKVSASAAVKDRLFKSELVFGLRSRNIQNWADGYFRYKLNTGYSLRREDRDMILLYENSTTDIRKQYLFEYDQLVVYPSKFWQTYVLTTNESSTSDARLDQLVPMIRISEMYYILAETDQSVEKSVEYLNKVRGARAILPLATNYVDNSTILNEEIQKEYQKEFYGEGQLFFYYKRNQSANMQFRSTPMISSDYVLPIPQDELEYNPNY
jgi:hypothetical protein